MNGPQLLFLSFGLAPEESTGALSMVVRFDLRPFAPATIVDGVSEGVHTWMNDTRQVLCTIKSRCGIFRPQGRQHPAC